MQTIVIVGGGAGGLELATRLGDSVGRAGTCLGSERMLRQAFELHADPQRIEVVKGWFADTFPAHVDRIESVAVLHVDGDWYDSVKLTLEAFYDKVSPGGIVAIDDYGHWKGSRRAVDDFRAERGVVAPMTAVDYSGRYWRV